MKAFALSPEQVQMLEAGFTHVPGSTDLSRCEHVKLLLDGHRRALGIYLWVMRQNDLRYRVYAGKTRSTAAHASSLLDDGPEFLGQWPSFLRGGPH